MQVGPRSRRRHVGQVRAPGLEPRELLRHDTMDPSPFGVAVNVQDLQRVQLLLIS